MKKRKILLVITVVELLLLWILGFIGLRVESELGNFFGILLALIAPCAYLISVGVDKNISSKKRIIALIVVIFLIVTFILSSVLTFLS